METRKMEGRARAMESDKASMEREKQIEMNGEGAERRRMKSLRQRRE